MPNFRYTAQPLDGKGDPEQGTVTAADRKEAEILVNAKFKGPMVISLSEEGDADRIARELGIQPGGAAEAILKSSSKQ